MQHPYMKYEQTQLWHAIDSAISELERNQDVAISTARDYVIGYLCQHLVTQQMVVPASISKE